MANSLYIAIILVCFYDALIMMAIPSSTTYLVAGDGMAARMITTLMALGIGLFVLFTQGFLKFQNKWTLLFLVFMVFSSFHSPNINFESAFLPKDAGIFNFKPMFECLVYLFMCLGISSIALNQTAMDRIFMTLAWVGIIYSGYIILQHCGMDQIYKATNEESPDHLTRNPQDGGFISQPLFACALISLCFPFVFNFRKALAGIPILAVLLTGNRSGLIAIAISSLFLFDLTRRYTFYAFGAYIGILTLVMTIHWVFPGLDFHVNPSGRLAEWKMMVQDIIHPIFPGIHKSYILTGVGIGSFSTLYPFYHHSGFYQAHNEYLETMYTLSFIGLFLFVKSIQHIFITSKEKTMTSGLVAISVFALTNPVWHIAQLQFLTVFLIGLVYNKDNSYGMVPTKTPDP